jgi:hypothetical protein
MQGYALQIEDELRRKAHQLARDCQVKVVPNAEDSCSLCAGISEESSGKRRRSYAHMYVMHLCMLRARELHRARTSACPTWEGKNLLRGERISEAKLRGQNNGPSENTLGVLHVCIEHDWLTRRGRSALPRVRAGTGYGKHNRRAAVDFVFLVGYHGIRFYLGIVHSSAAV